MASRDGRLICPCCDVVCTDVQWFSQHVLTHNQSREEGGDITFGFLCYCGKAFKRKWDLERHSKTVHDRLPRGPLKAVDIRWTGTGRNRRGIEVESYRTSGYSWPTEESRERNRSPDAKRGHTSRERRPSSSGASGSRHGGRTKTREPAARADTTTRSLDARREEADRRRHEALGGALAQREVLTLADFTSGQKRPGDETHLRSRSPVFERSTKDKDVTKRSRRPWQEGSSPELSSDEEGRPWGEGSEDLQSPARKRRRSPAEATLPESKTASPEQAALPEDCATASPVRQPDTRADTKLPRQAALPEDSTSAPPAEQPETGLEAQQGAPLNTPTGPRSSPQDDWMTQGTSDILDCLIGTDEGLNAAAMQQAVSCLVGLPSGSILFPNVYMGPNYTSAHRSTTGDSHDDEGTG